MGKAQDPPKPQRSQPLEKTDVLVEAVVQEADGDLYKLRGAAKVETVEMRVRADEIDYNRTSGYVEARGRVHFEHFDAGEELWADKVEYTLGDETGKFYDVRGISPVKLQQRPHVLTSTSPFSFQAKWAERIANRYILHDGMLTNCKLPRPWWTLRGPTFDLIPGERALAYKAIFRLRFVPLIYAPVFYKSLASQPRRSGLLTPNIGNSSRRGKMVGAGYYWAINRSYDATYRAQYFTERGFAHHIDFRGKPTQRSDFSAIFYGVQDRGLKMNDGSVVKQGGYIISVNGKADLKRGFLGRVDFNYLSSFVFRQSFTETFSEAVFSEVHSIGFVTKHWSTYSFTVMGQRRENYQSTQIDDKVQVRQLPQVEFHSVDREISRKVLPVWVSLDSEAGLLRRTQPQFQTRQYLERMEVAPRVMTALRWKDFHIVPSAAYRGARWGEQQRSGGIVGDNLNRNALDVGVDVILPALERFFSPPKWLGEKVRHVIEPRATYRYVTGVADFNSVIRFDEAELFSNTNEVELDLTNRLYAKKDGAVSEVLSWRLSQKRYFDPTFGGAVTAGQHNLVESVAQLTSYTFLDRPRGYSPVISVMRLNPTGNLGVEWRSDFDPRRNNIVNSSLDGNARMGSYYASAGYSRVLCVPLGPLSQTMPCESGVVPRLSPPANQFRTGLGYGSENKRGLVLGFSSVYDFRSGTMQFATTQATYNTDCCGFSVQYRRFNFGTRNENQFRIALSIANIGSFGTLKKQERLF